MSIRIHFLAAALIGFISVNTHSATLTVGEGAEFNFSTISSAVESATSGDTLMIASGVYNLEGGETFPIVIDKTLSLIGSSSAEVIVDATGSGARALRVDRPESFVMEGLTVTGGASPFDGGGLYCQRTNVTLRNCTFKGNQSLEDGGALRLALCHDVLIEDCAFLDNHAPGRFTFTDTGWTGSDGEGGAIDISLAAGNTAIFRNCLFRGNTCNGTGHAIIMDAGGSILEVVNCVFEENQFADSRIYLFHHSMISLPFEGSAVFRNCRFVRNGGVVDQFVPWNGPYVIEGDVVALEGCTVSENVGYSGVKFRTGTIFNSTIEGNDGIGIQIGGGSITESRIIGHPFVGVHASGVDRELQVIGTTVARNGLAVDRPLSVGRNTGGISAEFTTGHPLRSPNGAVQIESSLILENYGENGEPGGLFCVAREVLLVNSVVAGNSATGAAPAPGGMVCRGELVRIENSTFNGNQSSPPRFFSEVIPNALQAVHVDEVSIFNTILWDGEISIMTDPEATTVRYSALEQLIPGEGNIFTDPQFLHPWDGEFADLRLPCDSPAVDAGTLEGAPTRDIEGVTRPRGSGVDMGAYENCHFDVNGDRSEDRRDVVSFTAEWYRPIDETNFGFDLDRLPPSTGRIDRLDLDALLEAVK